MLQMLERDIEYYLNRQVARFGGYTRKLKFIGVTGGPDRLVLLNCHAVFVELKKPAKKAVKPSARQLEEHALLRSQGQFVRVINTREEVDDLILTCLAGR